MNVVLRFAFEYDAFKKVKEILNDIKDITFNLKIFAQNLKNTKNRLNDYDIN
jgi:hypothetical protein